MNNMVKWLMIGLVAGSVGGGCSMPTMPHLPGVNESQNDACIDLMDQVLDKLLQCRPDMSKDELALTDTRNHSICSHINPLTTDSKKVESDCIDDVMASSCADFNKVAYTCSALKTY